MLIEFSGKERGLPMRSWNLKSVVIVAGLVAVAVGMGAFAARSATTESEWALKGSWSDTCSCKVSCPCFFGSEPTEAFCEGSSLFEVEEGHYGGVEIDGLTAVVSYRAAKWTRIYVVDTATPEQVDAVASVIPLAVPFLGLGPIETVEVAPLSVERTETMLKYAAPESSVELEIVMGANGEPIRLANLPLKGLPFPEVHDHTQYRSVRSKHDSEEHHFEWSGRSGFVSKVDRAGNLPSGDS
jgi:hypothetical protein